ncbi:PREDICTED: cytochrome P450 71B26-like [Brassica oleracea var. oleracea]|uniref:cytochrome P450 71B26-like n=1 Tax=Brassica oleracea var. oleracea TaxID=109376 RepID=UPI0006A6E4A8|nr:PREDICTED: cytochrome P450 71B26-like [Brassica oleracea var. oleracea]
MDNIWVLPLLFLIYFVVLDAYKRSKRQQLRKPPSPPGYPIIGNLHQLGVLPHQSLWTLSKKYGPVMLLNLGKVPMVILSSVETAKQALRDHDIHCCSRPTAAGFRELSYNNLDIAFSPFSDYWKDVRKLAVKELFSTKQVHSVKPIMDEEVKKLMDSVVESASQKIPISINKTFLDLTKRVVCKAAFGVSFEGIGIKSDGFNKLVREAFEMLGSFSAADFIPYVGWIIDQFTGLQGRRERSVRDLDAFYEYVIDLHKEEKKQGREDFVDLLLRLEKEGTVLGNDNLTRNHIKAILMNILLGGVETSAITLTWAMTELSRNHRVMKKVQSEIRNHQSEIRNQMGNKSIISFDDTDKLTYLKMVIKETWRLHPPIPLLSPREALSEFEINGYTIKAKTRLHVNVWAIGRDPDTWKDPEEFFPERFMDNSIDAKGLNFELLPFGSGRRICPAIFMGTTMVECGLANMLYNFDWKLPEGIMVEDIEMEESPGLSVSKKNELLLVPMKYLDH